MADGTRLLRVARPEEVARQRHDPVDAETLRVAAEIVDDVRERGEAALREHAERFGDTAPGAALIIERDALDAAAAEVPSRDREVLARTCDRVRAFASAQRECLSECRAPVPGGHAGHDVVAVERAGCYAPGGRFPLPSTVLMTAATARVAGVETVWVASPKPTAITLAAAAIAGADALLACGGAHAIAALAYGAGSVPACDAVVGPGSRWVTAAKQLVAGRVAIDMLAGPSELVILADAGADAATVAADLLAQAEHDPDALPVLVTPSAELIEAVEAELAAQLATLPTAPIARQALGNGRAVLVDDLGAGVDVCNELAPEHLQVLTGSPAEIAPRLRHYGGLFLGERSAEVLGDYGAGPNHTLPTGGTARSSGGLSVLTFLRVRTRLQIDDAEGARDLVGDAAHLARLEGLEAHARAAERRRP